MKLRAYHIKFCHDVLETGNPSEAYRRNFKTKNHNVTNAGSSRLMKVPEIQEYISTLRKEKEEILKQARAEELERMKEDIITEIELEKFHTDVLRNDITVEEIVVMREFVPAHFEEVGKNRVQVPGKWINTIKKIHRSPNLREKQISADQLFKRKGSYAPIKIKAKVEGKIETNTDVTRMLRLSNGELIPIPVTNG